MADERRTVVQIVATDVETGESGNRDLPAGEYFLLCTEPCHLDSVQQYGNGTVVLTIKGRLTS